MDLLSAPLKRRRDFRWITDLCLFTRGVWQIAHVDFLGHEEAIVFHTLSPILGRELDLQSTFSRDRPVRCTWTIATTNLDFSVNPRRRVPQVFIDEHALASTTTLPSLAMHLGSYMILSLLFV